MHKKSTLVSAIQPQRILSGKRISIPEAVLKKWHVDEGDFVLVKETKDGLVIVPAQISEKEIPA
ncbi:MAG: AbrB/MazE/SpoVT family DNA-binding domain-containing protein [Candidatus Nitrosotenuis sp.]